MLSKRASLHLKKIHFIQQDLWAVLLVHANSLLTSLNARNSLRGKGMEAAGVSDMDAVAAMFPLKKDAPHSSLRDGESSI